MNSSDLPPEDPIKPAITLAEDHARAKTAVLEMSQRLGDSVLEGNVTSVVIVSCKGANFSVSFGGLTDQIHALGLLQMAAMQMLRGVQSVPEAPMGPPQ